MEINGEPIDVIWVTRSATAWKHVSAGPAHLTRTIGVIADVAIAVFARLTGGVAVSVQGAILTTFTTYGKFANFSRVVMAAGIVAAHQGAR